MHCHLPFFKIFERCRTNVLLRWLNTVNIGTGSSPDKHIWLIALSNFINLFNTKNSHGLYQGYFLCLNEYHRPVIFSPASVYRSP